MKRMENESDSFPTSREPVNLEVKASIDELQSLKSKDSFLTKLDSKACFDPEESVTDIL